MALPVTKDYTGRTVDLEALQTAAKPSSLVRLSKTLRRNDLSRKITGIQKLVQRYVMLFLSQKNDIERAPRQGTDFVNAVHRGLVQNRTQIVTYFSFANAEVKKQLNSDDSDALPADERFESAALVDYYIDFGTATLYMKIRLTSLAGDNYTFTIPT